jgi:hypothetical protein
MKPSFCERALGLMAGAVATCPFLCDVAAADPIIGVGVSGRVEYSTNPFLLATTNAGAVRAVVSLSPYLENRTPRSSLRLSGNVSYSEYSRIYRGSADFTGQVDYQNSITSRFGLHASAAFDSSISRSYQPVPVDVTGVPTVLPSPTDVSLVGLIDRRETWRGGIGFSYTPDARNSFSLDYNGAVNRVPSTPILNGFATGENSTIGQEFGYRRTINSRLSLGASVGVSRIDYRGTALGDATIISPNVNASVKLSAFWTLSGGVGISLFRQNTAFGRESSRDLSANFSLCRSESRDSFCMSGSRSISPSSLGAARKTTSFGATYSYRLSSRDQLTFSGNYVRSDDAGFGLINKTDYLAGNASFHRQFTKNFALTVDGGFSRVTFAGTRSDARIGIGINYNLDNRR